MCYTPNQDAGLVCRMLRRPNTVCSPGYDPDCRPLECLCPS
jgi:hypothetical protein